MCRTKVDNERDNKKKINYTRKDQESKEGDNEYAFVVNHLSEENSGLVDVQVGEVLCNFLIDSGSTCNVIDKSCWEKPKAKSIKGKSEKTATQIYSYGSRKPLNVAGKFTADVVCQGKVKETEFI